MPQKEYLCQIISIIMKFKNAIFILTLAFIAIAKSFAQSEFTTCFFDSIRNRPISIAVYQPGKVSKHNPIIIFNHGYDGNKNPTSNKSYSYLTRFLSEKGYYVISIQHELPNDPLLAMKGNFMETRMPNWQRGVQNILFTIHEFRKLKPELNWEDVTMIGHSNGGDMTMLLATEHPDLIKKAISMDHRRMIMPRSSNPRIYSLRGSDYEADPGVLPTVEEQQKYHITIIKLKGITHSDMGHQGSKEQHDIIKQHIYNFLKE